MTVVNTQDPYLWYYRNQLGSGVSVVYRGAPYQRGHGIGSFLGGLFRSISPLLKSGAKAVGQEALKTGINVLSDMVGAVPPKRAFESRIKEFTTNLKRRADNKVDSVMKGSGYKRKRQRVTTQSLQRLLAIRPTRAQKKKKTIKKKKVTKRTTTDIFN